MRLSVLIAMIAVLVACGGASTSPSGTGAGAGDAGAGGAGGGGSGGDGGSEQTYTLTVEDGYGSGSYVPGDVVHVWAASDPLVDLVTWTGDVDLMEGPGEWHSTLTMPERDVTLSAFIEAAELTIDTAVVPGAERDKSVRYHVPADVVGLVAVMHGTGGDGDFLLRGETSFVARKLAAAGYAVFSTDAEEVDAGDTDENGTIQWDVSATASNVDLQNLAIIFDGFETQGLVPTGTPRFVFGMSNGGAMALAMGAAGLGVQAVVSYCASGRTPAAEATTTPTAWYLCGEDQNNSLNNDKAVEHHELLVERGVASELVVHPPSPLYAERFARVEGIDEVSSATLVTELAAGGFVDSTGMVTAFSPAIAAAMDAAPESYPTWSALPAGVANRALGQLRIVTADHRFFDDYAARTLAWFEAMQ